MYSVRLEEALTEFIEAAAARLHAEVQAGAEVPFELESQGGRRRGAGPSLYCYRALTGEFISERQAMLEQLPSYSEAARLLAGFEGLDRYLSGAGVDPVRGNGSLRVRSGMRALLRDVFAEQSDFELHPDRLRAALARLEQAAFAGGGGVTLVATLHGLTITSPEVALTNGLSIGRPEALGGLPEAAVAPGVEGVPDHLVAVFVSEEEDPRRAIAHGREVLKDLLRALRLFGDGRVTLGALAFSRVAGGGWNALALGAGGRPHGMLLVTGEQEDELRAFCNLVSRRAPQGNELAWALRRFELGSERESSYEALTDHLLALRALLEPEGPSSGLLAGRLAALCAIDEHRLALTERTLEALELERAVIAGSAVVHAGGEALARDIGDHLRALLRDVVCGHLDPDLVGLADDILLRSSAPAPGPEPEPIVAARLDEEMFGDPRESQEILDLFI
jgi:hypothetical protein